MASRSLRRQARRQPRASLSIYKLR
jgi:hypothetical protein